MDGYLSLGDPHPDPTVAQMSHKYSKWNQGRKAFTTQDTGFCFRQEKSLEIDLMVLREVTNE